jgi:glyoxylase-like metal-dependent hydrolase (beta-lactamase superfamily II)
MDTAHRHRSPPEKLADGLWLLGVSYFNLYLARGRRASALLEMGVSATADGIVSQLEAIGVSPDYLVVMHPHGDHLSGLPALRERFPAARVIIGAGAREFLAHPKTAAGIVADDRYYSDFLARQGLGSPRPPLWETPSLEGASPASDGEELDLGDLTLRFLDVKGHAPGSLAAVIPEIKVLLPSDSLGFRISALGFFPVYFTGYDDYMAALDRLQAIDQIILGLPHQGPLVGEKIDEAFRVSRETARNLCEKLRNERRPDVEVVRDIYEKYYRDELTLYSPENIVLCCRLLVRRSREAGGAV